MKKIRHNLMTLASIAGAVSAIFLFLRRWNRSFLLKKTGDSKIQEANGQAAPGKKVVVAVKLDCPLESAWQQVLTSGLMEYVAWPWLSFRSRDGAGLPDVWQAGDTVHVDLFFLNLFPLGSQRITIEEVDARTYSLQTRESGDLAQIWDHTIQLQEMSANETLYSDEVSLYAGERTAVLAWLVNAFFQHRQVRLQRMARRLG